MKTRTKLMVVGAASVVIAGAGGGLAIAGGGDDAEAPIRGEALGRASSAALDHLGGGTVTDTEVGDEESLYEVEVTRDGAEVDVQLDRTFKVVGLERDTGERDDD